MKISRVLENTPFGAITPAKEQKQNAGHEAPQDQNKQDNSESEEHVEVTDENVAQAIEKFTAENHLQATGMNISMQGQGPGLKVTLKDGSGAIIRQLSGEEFLKMRDMTQKEQRKVGKILDQKI